MKKIHLILLATVALLWGCSKDESLSQEEREKNDTYFFYEIRYRIDETNGDGVTEEKSRKGPGDKFYNRTSITQSYTTTDPYINEQEYSSFSVDEYPPYALEIDEDALIQVPESIFTPGSIWFRSGQEVFGLNATYFYPYDPPSKLISSTLQVPPNAQVITTREIRYNETVFSYTAVFIGRNTGKMLEITGKCTSSTITGTYEQMTISQIE